MLSTTVEQVIVGKMSPTQATGQTSLSALPHSFDWLTHFSAEEIAQFFVELLVALSQSEQHDSWSGVANVIANWKATANVKADPLVVAGVAQGLAVKVQ